MLGVCLAQSALATDYFWNVGNGSYNVGTSWNPNGVPGIFDNAFVNNGGTSNVVGTLNDLTNLSVGSLAGSSGTLNISGGSDLAVESAHFGDVGTAIGSITNSSLRAG